MKFEATNTNPYEKLYRRKLSDIEVAEIRQNLTGLYTLLIKIDRRLKKERAKDD